MTLQISAERRAYMVEYRKCNHHKTIMYQREYREKNKETLEIMAKVRRAKNKAHKARYDAVYFADNPPDTDKVRAKSHDWYVRNKAKVLAHSRAYQARKLHRSVAWADDDAIQFFYECRPVGCDVDHIIPLQGKNISGLHVENNLQWLPKSENRAKGNRWVE